MILFFQFLIASFIIFPIIGFIITLLLCRKLRIKKYKALGLAADITTFLLLFSIPIAIRGLWKLNVGIPMLVVMLLGAIIFTYIDWRTKKEIEVKPLLKKIWRTYFLVLSVIYFTVWIIGVTHSVMNFI